MLIKKTIVLQSGGQTVGYVTLVRVGSEVGVKTVLNVEPSDTLILGLKTTSGNLYTQKITSARTESKPDISLIPTDEIGVVVIDGSGMRICEGGRKETVNVHMLMRALEEDAQAELVAEQAEEKPVTDVRESKSEDSPLTPSAKEENAVIGSGKDDFPPFNMNKGENFYKNVKERLNDIMTENPQEKELESLIPESKWVRVYYDKDEYYVVGILSEEGEVTFLAYGVPGVKGVRPPKEAEELCDFLELPSGRGEGYWIMFQNAANGEIAKSI